MMHETEKLFALRTNSGLLRLLPHINRARLWRLYTADGKRLVDLWQYGGRAILGHNPPALLRTIKNSGERGLFAPVPHAAEGRLYKALSLLLPGRRFRLYENEEALYSASCAAGTGYVPGVWRPYLEPAEPGQKTPEAAKPVSPPPESALLVPVLPLPFPGAPAVLALDPALDGAFPPSPVLSPAALAAAARSVYTLLASPERGNPRFPKVDRALKNNPVWKRRGIYFFYGPGPDAAAGKDAAAAGENVAASGENVAVSGNAATGVTEDYAALFRRFLDGGFLLPPGQEEPAILPGELSPGEEAKLAALI